MAMAALLPFVAGEPAYIFVKGCPPFAPSSLPEEGMSSASTSPRYLGSERSTSEHAGSDSEASASPRGERPLVGRVWRLSQDPAGTRLVQEALEQAGSDEVREAYVRELHGHAVAAMKDPHANHVLQRCISTVPPSSLQFIVEELGAEAGLVTKMAKHRYGCRIVQQLLKACPAAQIGELAEAVLRDAVELSCHAYGNFAVQHLLRHGTEDQRRRLAQLVVSNVQVLCSRGFECGVVAAFMEDAAAEEARVQIARAALREPGSLVALARSRRGSGAVLRMLEVLSGLECVQACMSLVQEIETLRASRYGRVVVQGLKKQVPDMLVQ